MNRLYSVSKIFALALLLASCQSTPQREELARDYYNVGNAYFDLGQFDKAAEYYNRSLELDSSINQAVFNLARTNLEIGNYRTSLKLLNQLQEKDPVNVMVLEMLAYAYYKMDKTDEAVEHYESILGINAYNKRALYNLSLLEKEREDRSAARFYLNRLLELEDKVEYRRLLAELAVADDDLELAISLYESMLVDDQGSYDTYEALKDLYISAEQYYSADEMYHRLLSSSGVGDNKESLLFERCRIEFLYLEDHVTAQEHLIEALDLGFGMENREPLDILIEELDAVVGRQVKSIVDEHLQKFSEETEVSEKVDNKKNENE